MTNRSIHQFNNQQSAPTTTAVAAVAAEATDTPEVRAFQQTTGRRYDYRVIDRGSKIGIHSMRPSTMLNNIRALRDRGGRFPVVKAVNDIDWLGDVKAIDPNIVTIGRLAFNRDGIGEGLNGIHEVTNDDFSRYIDTMFEPVEERLQIRPELREAIDYWEICNEPDPPGTHGYRNLSLAMMGAMDRANSMGLKLAIFALNAGTPEWFEAETMVSTGVFAKAKAGGHIMTMHEGVFRDPIQGWIHPVNQWYGDPIPANEAFDRWVQIREGGAFFFDHHDSNPRPSFWADGIAGPLCFRYRYLYELLKQRDEVIPLVVSEIVYGEGYGQTGSNAAEMVNRAAWYDAKAAEDYYVWAHLPFTYGGTGSGWDLQDYDFSISSVVDYAAAQKNRPNATAPTAPPATPVPPATTATTPPVAPPTIIPTPIPISRPFQVFMPVMVRPAAPMATSQPTSTPTVQLPQVNRAIKINLLPKNATLNERLYVLAQTDAKRENILQSAIEARNLASMGNDDSFVKAWAVNRWSTSIVDFMNQQGVRTEPHAIPSQEADWQISPWEDARPIVVNMLPQNATFAEKSEVAAAVHNRREAMMQAEQDCVDLVRIGPAGSKIVVWSPERWSGDIMAWLNERGVVYEIKAFGARRSNRVFFD